MSSIKSLLLLSARQRKLCKRLEAGRGRLFRMAYAWSHNRDVADEVVQETMIKAMHNVDKIKDVAAMDSWLFRVLSNCFIDLCRKRREEIDVDEIKLFSPDTPETINLRNEMLISVREAIAGLPLKHRQVITLIDIESFSYAEVSNILGIPPGTVMSRLNRARQSLKKTLDQPAMTGNDKRQHGANLKVVK
ncbi:MAG: RNA polymerase sigma factor [Proteobacteria bacterium]|nr:RNA polymerase sigma factor [Pseudomonadota bacterium]